MTKQTWMIGLLALGGVFLMGAPAVSREGLKTSGWLVYWDQEGGEKTVQDLGGRLDEICIFAYHFNSDGRLIPGSDDIPNQLQAWKNRPSAQRPRLWITIVNDKVGGDPVLFKDPGVVHDVLADPGAQEQHIQELLELSKDADGLEIDYENLKVSDRELFAQFLGKLGPLLRARGQLLSVVLEPRTEKQEKVEGPGAMDWSDIGKSADRVRVMAYFLHYGGGKSGPTAPPSWVSDILDFALARIPTEKIDIAFCLDGIDWKAAGQGSELSFENSEERRRQHQAKRLRSGLGEPPHFTYKDGSNTHHVWYEDSESLREKMRRVQQKGLTRVSFWRLGAGDPAFWKWLASQKGSSKPRK